MGQFYYFISSLPMLHFGMKPPFLLEEFLPRCREFISEQDYQILRQLPLPDSYGSDICARPLIVQWVAFDTALRNELVKIRTARKHLEPSAYTRPTSYNEASLTQQAMSIHRIPAILDAERLFDEIRWQALEELCTGHYFDLEVLITYTYKLMILERWAKIHGAQKTRLLEEALNIN